MINRVIYFKDKDNSPPPPSALPNLTSKKMGMRFCVFFFFLQIFVYLNVINKRASLTFSYSVVAVGIQQLMFVRCVFHMAASHSFSHIKHTHQAHTQPELLLFNVDSCWPKNITMRTVNVWYILFCCESCKTEICSYRIYILYNICHPTFITIH